MTAPKITKKAEPVSTTFLAVVEDRYSNTALLGGHSMEDIQKQLQESLGDDGIGLDGNVECLDDDLDSLQITVYTVIGKQEFTAAPAGVVITAKGATR